MHRKECAGSIAYEARLATAYLVAKQPEKAREIIRPFVGRPSELSYLVDYAQLQIDYFEKGLFVQATMDDVKQLEKEAAAFVQKAPSFPDGQALLGSLQTLLGDYSAAVKSLEP